jgi:predicted lactoylglutathione lyase
MISDYGKIKNSYVLTKKEYAGNCSICNETICKGGVYFTHMFGKSWNDTDSKIFNFLLCNKNKIIGGILIGAGVILFNY